MSTLEKIDPIVDTKGGEEQMNTTPKIKENVETAEENQTKVIQTDNADAVGSWTIIYKEGVTFDNEDHLFGVNNEKKKLKILSRREGESKNNISENSSSRESDSESIEVISEDEFLVSSTITSCVHLLGESSMINNSSSFPSPITPSDSISFPSSITPNDSISCPGLISQHSSEGSILSDGIPIADYNQNDLLDQPLYIWNNDEELEVNKTDTDKVSGEDDVMENDPEQELEHGVSEYDLDDYYNDVPGLKIEHRNPNHILKNEREHGEPGNDLYDDGLPGAPLLPLDDNGDLYPSQELDENFPLIEKGEVYKHSRNRNLNYFPTGLLVVVLAMVIGLGVGHFLGFSERMEVQEMYESIQGAKLETITDELVTCMTGEEEVGNDQDLDVRVIRQLRDENEELRDQIEKLRSSVNSQGEEAMLVILRNGIETLLVANADLGRDVARLKIIADKVAHMTVAQKAAMALGKTLANAVKILIDPREEATLENKNDWPHILNQEVANFITGLEKKWEEIKNKCVYIDEIMEKTEKHTEKSKMENVMKEIKRKKYNDWNSKRRDARQKSRVSNAGADWIFERAKYRNDVRQEESRSNWYFENKHDSSETYYQQNNWKKARTCFNGCKADDKEKAYKLKKFKRNNGKENRR